MKYILVIIYTFLAVYLTTEKKLKKLNMNIVKINNGKVELRKEIVVESIVNTIARRDYTNNGNVQDMLFSDHLEVINPGALPLGWTTEKLKTLHTSVPANPLLAEPMYLKGYIERLGTGTADIMRIAKEKNLQAPDFEQSDDFKAILYRPSTDQVPTKYPSSTEGVPQYFRRS
jgi:predicted HTH transcriptional regulator